MNVAMSETLCFGTEIRWLKTRVAEDRPIAAGNGLVNIQITHGTIMDPRRKTTEPEKPWHMLVVYTMALLVGAASTLMGIMVVEWVIELFWEFVS